MADTWVITVDKSADAFEVAPRPLTGIQRLAVDFRPDNTGPDDETVDVSIFVVQQFAHFDEEDFRG